MPYKNVYKHWKINIIIRKICSGFNKLLKLIFIFNVLVASGHYIYPAVVNELGCYADLISVPLWLPKTVQNVQVSVLADINIHRRLLCYIYQTILRKS